MNPVPTRPSRTTRLVSAWQRWRGTLKPMLDTLPCIAVPAAGIEALSGPQAFRENYQRDMPIWKALVEAAGARLD